MYVDIGRASPGGVEIPGRMSLCAAATAVSGWPNSTFNGKEVVLEKLSSAVATRPTHTVPIYSHFRHKFRHEPSQKGPLLISRNLLLHFIEEGHGCPDGKVICLSSGSNFVPELGLEPRPLDSSPSALPLYQVVCIFVVFKCELTWRGCASPPSSERSARRSRAC